MRKVCNIETFCPCSATLVPVILFKDDIIGNNLRSISLKLIDFENFTFNWPPFCLYAKFGNFCPHFVNHGSIFSDFGVKMFKIAGFLQSNLL